MKAEIDVGADGTGKLLLDGIDVSRGVRGFHLRAQAGDWTALELVVAIDDVSLSVETPHIYIGPEAEALLAQLGWTPPDLTSAPETAADRPS